MSAMLSRDKPPQRARQDAVFLMFPLLFALLIAPFGLAASISAEPSELKGEALRQAVSARTAIIATAMGSFRIRYNSDGTMTGRAPALVAGLGTQRDRGRWWIADDSLCQRWHQWLGAKRYCFKLQQHVGATVYWLRDDGLSGTATIRGGGRPRAPRPRRDQR